ncbi:MAG TPA: NAD(P)H-dependent oxidoreductase subunit E, partial [Nodosilinea sp.]|nr:NAD(P)H-dependent oxidoreductase subunit E [Nodosilinea sp.]
MTLQDPPQLSTPPPMPYRIRCCTVGGCLSANSLTVKTQLETAVTAAGLGDRVIVSGVGCMGLCSRGPLVQIDPSGDLYASVTPDQAAHIVASVANSQESQATSQNPKTILPSPHLPTAISPTIPFFTRQHRIVLENSGLIDPERIEDYIAAQGYEALHQSLRDMEPAAVVD